MASKHKKTPVTQRDYAAIPAHALRILAYLMEKGAYSLDTAIKIAKVALAIGVDPDEVAFDSLETFSPGFAVLMIPASAHPAHAAVYIETEAGAIREYVLHLESQVCHLSGRAEGLKNLAAAMAGCCHRWSV